MTNYRKDGSRFKNWIRLFPLFNDGAVSYFLAIMEDASRFFAQKPFYFNGQGIPKNIVTSKASSIDNNGSSSSVHTMTENSKSQNNSYTVSSLDDSSSTNSGSSRSGKSRKSQVNLRDSDTKPSTELSGSNDYNNVQYCGNNRDDMSLGITDTSRSYNPDRNVLTTINSAMDDLLAENDPKNERKNCRSENNPQYFDNYGQDGLDDNTSLGDDLLDGVFMEFDRKTSNEAGFYDDN